MKLIALDDILLPQDGGQLNTEVKAGQDFTVDDDAGERLLELGKAAKPSDKEAKQAKAEAKEAEAAAA